MSDINNNPIEKCSNKVVNLNKFACCILEEDIIRLIREYSDMKLKLECKNYICLLSFKAK